MHLGSTGTGDSPEGGVHSAPARAGKELSISRRWAWPVHTDQSADPPLRQFPRPNHGACATGATQIPLSPRALSAARSELGCPEFPQKRGEKERWGPLGMGKAERRYEEEVPQSRGCR